MSSAPSRESWVERYLTQLSTQRQLSPLTVDAYRRDLAELLAATPGKTWEELTWHDIRRIASSLHAKELAPRSIARKLSSWRVFFAWLARETPLAANPVDAIRAPKRPKSLPKALAVDQAVQLVSAPAHPHANPEPADLCNRAMFELLYSSGLRVSELAGLDVAYRQQAGTASLGWVDLDGGEVLVTGKGNKMRKVPVGSHALAALRDWLAVRPVPSDGSAALFVSSRGARISPRVIQQRLKTHAIRSGTPVHVHPHMLRHSFASHVLQSSGDLRAVQEMLGHASIASTQVYTALDFQHLAAVYDKAHPRAHRKDGGDDDGGADTGQ
jgi:integrase/recombinase XerC